MSSKGLGVLEAVEALNRYLSNARVETERRFSTNFFAGSKLSYASLTALQTYNEWNSFGL